MRPFVVLAVNVIVGSVGLWVGGFAGGCVLAALGVADCMLVVAEGRAWKREDAADTVYDWSTHDPPGLDAETETNGSHVRHLSDMRQPTDTLGYRGWRSGSAGDGDARSEACLLGRAAEASAVARPFDWGREGRAG